MKKYKFKMLANSKTLLFGLLLTIAPVAGAAALGAPMAYAAPNCSSTSGYTYNPDTNSCVKDTPTPAGGSTTDTPAAGPSTPKVVPYAPTGAEVDPAISGKTCVANSNGSVDASNCDLVANYIDPAIGFLTAAIGIAVAAAVIYGGIEIGSSAGDPSRAASGKKHIRTALFTLVVYFFLWSLLNFLVPGGIK